MQTQQALPTAAVDRTRRITFLEGARGVAAFMVLAQHLIADQYPGYRAWSHDWVDLGRVGVVAFFLVSGYVIPLSLAGQSLRAFAVRRFFRLYPVYWLAFALYLLADPGALGGAGAPVVLLNVAMLHGLVGALSILPPAWTLSIELLFYVQSAAAKAIRLLDTAVYAGYGWLALYLLLCVGEMTTGRDLPTTLPMLLFVAALGHALHLRDARGHRAWQGLLAAGAVAVPAGAYVGVDGGGEWPPFTYSASFLAGLALFGGFYVARRHRFGRTLVLLGAISYAVYLIHPIVMAVTERLTWLPDGWAVVAVDVAATTGIGWLVHRLLELPSIGVGRRLSRTRRSGEPAATPAATPAAAAPVAPAAGNVSSV
ncbi:acyltransferase [Dactylosporangium sp. NPDC049525]|uniref:acyltransferase family protein n=1 Tax=Dactylosporangium sp. NPDC049525 TaxID=3154730 RepID=UPI0034259104